LLILALAVAVYLFTFETSALAIFPTVLLVSGVSMEVFLERKKGGAVEVADDGFEPRTLKIVGFYAAIGLLGMFLTGYAIKFVPGLETQTVLASSPINGMLYSVLMAIAEEQFFRGFLTDWLLSHLKNAIMAIVASAGVFCAYHFARYGTSPNALLYVFGGGLILAWVAFKSKRISPTMISHAGNNMFAYLGQIVPRMVNLLCR
jgi:membrane protease YdiL (CAAX protease family)